MKAAKIFTRENPCTKVDLHNCFYSKGAYVNRKLVDAKMVIGDNAPKYLVREGYIEQRLIEGADWYVVTIAGKAWLRAGILRYLQLHPEAITLCNELPAGVEVPPGVTRPRKNLVIRRRRPS